MMNRINILNETNETQETMNTFQFVAEAIYWMLEYALVWRQEKDVDISEEDRLELHSLTEALLAPSFTSLPTTKAWYEAGDVPTWLRLKNGLSTMGHDVIPIVRFILAVADQQSSTLFNRMVDILKANNPALVDELTSIRRSDWQLFVNYKVDGSRERFPRSSHKGTSIDRKHPYLKGKNGGPTPLNMDIWSELQWDEYRPVSDFISELARLPVDVKVCLDYGDGNAGELLVTGPVDPTGPIAHQFSKIWLSSEAGEEILRKINHILHAEEQIPLYSDPNKGIIRHERPTVSVYLLSEWIVLEG